MNAQRKTKTQIDLTRAVEAQMRRLNLEPLGITSGARRPRWSTYDDLLWKRFRYFYLLTATGKELDLDELCNRYTETWEALCTHIGRPAALKLFWRWIEDLPRCLRSDVDPDGG